MEETSGGRLRRRLLIVAVLLLLVGKSYPLLRGRVPILGDLGGYHVPLRHFYARCLEAVDRFDWSPNLFGGFYLQGEGQLGMYHPLHWLLYGNLSLATALNLELLANDVLAWPAWWSSCVVADWRVTRPCSAG